MAASVRVHRWRGAAAVTLAAGKLEATFVPELNLLGTSLRLGGEEFLVLRGGIAGYRRRSTTGLPLLAPWANRLSALEYRIAGTRVDLRGIDLKTDGNGLPMHGAMWGAEWEIASLRASGTTAHLRATFAYTEAELLRAFPFPHRLAIEVRVDPRALSVTTTLTPAAADRAVPVSFGFHPYLRLPGGRSSAWLLRLPDRERLVLDERMIPTGRRVPEPAEADPIRDRTFDTPYAISGDRVLGLEGSRSRIELHLDDGFPYAQVYAPPRSSFVCLEPMTAAPNALRTRACPVVEPGDAFSAGFRLVPSSQVGRQPIGS